MCAILTLKSVTTCKSHRNERWQEKAWKCPSGYHVSSLLGAVPIPYLSFPKLCIFQFFGECKHILQKKYNYCCLECPNTSCTASFLVLMSLSSISFPMLCNVMGIIWSVPKKSSIPFQPKSVQPLGHSRMLYFSSHQQLPKGSRTAYKSDEILGVFSPQWSVLVKRFQKVLDRTWRYVK